jgi:DMSO/TMAO reductase YedYZ molybdopterin-dependent catalytic subunit
LTVIVAARTSRRFKRKYRHPVRLRAENQLGYKMVEWIERTEFIESEKQIGKGEGGTNEGDD